MRARPIRYAQLVSLSVTVALVGACVGGERDPGSEDKEATHAVVQEPEAATVLLGAADPAELALTTSQAVFSHAPVAVVAPHAGPGDLGRAAPAQAALAEALHAPALVVGGGASAHGVTGELQRLAVQTVVVVEPRGAEVADGDEGDEAVETSTSVTARAALAAGAEVVLVDPTSVPLPDAAEDDEQDLPRLSESQAAAVRQAVDVDLPVAPDDAVQLREVLALTDPQPGQEAAIATLRAAGAFDYVVPDGDIAGSAEAIARIDAAQALTVVGVGPSFGDPATFAWRVAAAERGSLLPTGTQHLVPAQFVMTSATVGEDPAAVVARAADAAESYGSWGDDPVLPVVSVRASESAWYPGEDGSWVERADLAELTELVTAVREADQLVLLDVAGGLQPLVEGVAAFEELVKQPGVGVAVRPEQRRGDASTPSQRVPVDEVQDVVDYIAGLVTNRGLPPTMVVVHQTRPESVDGRERLAGTDQVEVVLLADRTGGPTTGEWVWGRVSHDVPDGVHVGWSGPTGSLDRAADLVPLDPVPLLVAGP